MLGRYATHIHHVGSMSNDPRPAVETWQLNTVKGKTLLTLQTVAGERTYKAGDLVTQEDFYFWQHAGKPDKFRGSVRSTSTCWDPAIQKARQNYTVEVTEHDAIKDGRFKPRTTLKAKPPVQPGAPACGAVLVTPQTEGLKKLFGLDQQPDKPAGPGVRKFNFEEE